MIIKLPSLKLKQLVPRQQLQQRRHQQPNFLKTSFSMNRPMRTWHFSQQMHRLLQLIGSQVELTHQQFKVVTTPTPMRALTYLSTTKP